MACKNDSNYLNTNNITTAHIVEKFSNVAAQYTSHIASANRAILVHIFLMYSLLRQQCWTIA